MEQQKQMAKNCTKRLIQTKEFQAAKTILIYISYNGEMMTDYIIDEARRQNKIVAAPTVLGREMEFFTFSSKEELVKEKHGILEPIPSEKTKIREEEALIIMPGVAFDEEKNRVGYGGGFYDKYLQKHPNLKKIAIAYEFQIVDFVPTDEFDQKPDCIITEERVIF
ncbi:MAG: 5-formyltetrahydrofolate cyclo-ligase [Lachnospiraceae bacterium]